MQQLEKEIIMDKKIETEDDLDDVVFKMFQSRPEQKLTTPDETVTA